VSSEITFARAAVVTLTVLLAGAHSYLGERFILRRLFRRDLPKLFGGPEFTRNTLRFAWHLTTVAYIGLAAVLMALPPRDGSSPSTPARVVAATFAISGVVALVGSRGRHLSWVVFFAIALFAWWA
jgi:hypothetical protein